MLFRVFVVGGGWGGCMVPRETMEEASVGFIPQVCCCRVRNLNDRIRRVSLLGGKKTPLGQRMRWGWGWGRKRTLPHLHFFWAFKALADTEE